MNDEYLIYGETLTAIADSIRSVSSVSTTWTPDEMAAYILANLVKPTSRQAAKTYTPSTSNQTIPAGTFLTGAATIQGDADLTAANIKKGVNIFGKTGTLSGVWGDISGFYGLTNIKSGSVTITTSVVSQTITHNLGVKPRLILYIVEGGNSSTEHLGGIAFTNTSDALNNGAASVNKLSDGCYLTAAFIQGNYGGVTNGGAANANIQMGNSSKIPPLYSTSNTYANDPYKGLIVFCTTTAFTILLDSSNCKATYKWFVMA